MYIEEYFTHVMLTKDCKVSNRFNYSFKKGEVGRIIDRHPLYGPLINFKINNFWLSSFKESEYVLVRK